MAVGVDAAVARRGRRAISPLHLSIPLILTAAFTAESQAVYGARLFGVDCIVKHREPKAYRHASLDARLTAERLSAEARCIARASKAGVPVPRLLLCDRRRAIIVTERVCGRTLRALIDDRAAATHSPSRLID